MENMIFILLFQLAAAIFMLYAGVQFLKGKSWARIIYIIFTYISMASVIVGAYVSRLLVQQMNKFYLVLDKTSRALMPSLGALDKNISIAFVVLTLLLVGLHIMILRLLYKPNFKSYFL